MFIIFDNIKTNPETLELLQKAHNIITDVYKDISFRVFPIYVKYYFDLKPVLIIYFKGKFIEKGELDIGVNLEAIPDIKGFRDASYMKDGKIKYSILINASNYSGDLIRQIVRLVS